MSVIKNKREQLGYTQAELAEKSSLSLRTIQRLEANNKVPKGHTLVALSQAFKMEPAALTEKFNVKKEDQQSETTSIQLINLSILSFLGIPFGNIIFPFILWSKNRNSPLVDEMGRRIINAQILFSILLSFLLCISPLVSRLLFPSTPIILYVLAIAYAFNIMLVFINARKLKQNQLDFLNLPIRLF